MANSRRARIHSRTGLFGVDNINQPNTRSFTSSSTSLSAAASVSFDSSLSDNDYNALHIVGKASTLKNFPSNLLPDSIPSSLWQHMIDNTKSGKNGKTWSTLVMQNDTPISLSVHVLPEKVSRHNTPLMTHTITNLLGKAPSSPPSASSEDDSDDNPQEQDTKIKVLALVDDASHKSAIGMAIARTLPVYSNKGKTSKSSTSYNVQFLDVASGDIVQDDDNYAQYASDAVRLAGRIVDTPPNEMNVSEFINEAEMVKDRLTKLGHDITMEIIRGEELKEGGYGGLYNVGKAGIDEPAMVVLTKTFDDVHDDGEVVALVGKGIIYDTGGLSLKPGTGMCGMKTDCGGAAGVLGGFEAAVACGTSSIKKLTAILCLAENAIGPNSFRNDDIIKFLSGRTCEINNTDAEGRLVLADGVAHATMKCEPMPNLVLDMATLTGAQLVSTGKRHSSIVTNCEATEIRAIAAGKRSGDLVHPLIYCPEFLNDEFASKVADSKNSVKDRMNAQSSCAAHFVGNNLSDEFYDAGGAWLHVDMAGPSVSNGRGTGYGVGLILSLLECNGFK